MLDTISNYLSTYIVKVIFFVAIVWRSLEDSDNLHLLLCGLLLGYIILIFKDFIYYSNGVKYGRKKRHGKGSLS